MSTVCAACLALSLSSCPCSDSSSARFASPLWRSSSSESRLFCAAVADDCAAAAASSALDLSWVICFSMAARRSLRFIEVFSETAASDAALASVRDSASRVCIELTNSLVLVDPVTTLITSEASEPCIESRAIWATAACASS